MPSKFTNIAGYSATLAQLEDLADQWGGDATWAVGTNVEYGLYLETGTSKMPPYPWLGPAIDDVVSSGKADRIADRADSAEEVVKGIAQAIEQSARERTMSTSERPYPQTGNLASSIKAVKLS